MIYVLDDVECCEPTMLRVDPKVWVRPSAQPVHSMCATAAIFSEDRAALEAYVRDQWGDDEATGGWTSDVLSSVVEVDAEPTTWIVSDTADGTNELAHFRTHHPLDALSEYAIGLGFVSYSDLIAADEANGIVYDSENGGWSGYTEDLEMWGIFTNFTIYALDAWEVGKD